MFCHVLSGFVASSGNILFHTGSLGFMDPHSLGQHPKVNISYLARESCSKSHLLKKKINFFVYAHVSQYICVYKGPNSVAR